MQTARDRSCKIDLAWIYTLKGQSKAFSAVHLVKRALGHSRALMHEQTLF